ncbi:MAG TPA: BtrH N-terminal domain-containing protein [Solirubrobacterales bacterium]|jgi:hypothetical protein|nr:BtrH N-terminal domain-containing protein [Solirubrobacterales bacterium]
MVPGYVHHTGHHCGSTAVRNLLAFHGCEISEEMAFGLGAGAAFFYVPLDGQSPSRFTNGRTARLEENFLELTGAPLRLRTDPDPDRCWQLARAGVDDGRPVLLLTDLYYLDHYGTSAHFPGHAVILAGYDSQNAWLSDTGFEELQSTRLEHLSQARHSKHPAFPLDGQMIDLAPTSGGGSPGVGAPRGRAAAVGGAGGNRARPMACSSPRWATSRACRRWSALPRRSAPGRRPCRTRSGAPVSSSK